jgi:membrane carboxypeptidase/penicillin-binding protein
MDFWKEVTAERPVEEFPIPGNIVFVPVDASGRPGAPGEPGVRMEAFVSGTEPRARMATPRPTP